jgi:hypothetical protein
MSLPWKAKGRRIYTTTGDVVAEAWETGAKNSAEIAAHDAAFIVRACNAHDDLLAALKNLADEFDEFMSEHGQLDNKPLHAARAAIAKAEE